MKKVKCEHKSLTDLTCGYGNIRNLYCSECGYHKYKGKEYTKEEWFKYMNDEIGWLIIDKELY